MIFVEDKTESVASLPLYGFTRTGTKTFTLLSKDLEK